MAASIKKSTFTIFLWLASDFTENLEQIRTHIPFFLELVLGSSTFKQLSNLQINSFAPILVCMIYLMDSLMTGAVWLMRQR